MQKKFQKMFLVCVIMAFEPFARSYLYYEENSSNRQSTCYQTVIRSHIWLREMFSNSVLSWINGKLGQKCHHAEFVGVWDPWTRWFPKVLLKRELSGIQRTTFIAVNDFQDIWAMKLIFFFLKCAKFSVYFGNAKKIEEIFLVFVIMVFQPFAGTYLCYEENSCDRQSTCYKTVLRSQIWLTEISSNSILPWITWKLG